MTINFAIKLLMYLREIKTRQNKNPASRTVAEMSERRLLWWIGEETSATVFSFPSKSYEAVVCKK
jgi:hypothetical protein